MSDAAEVRPYCYDDIWQTAYGDMQDLGPVHRHMRRIVGRMLGELEYDSVLDVGCGTGHNLPELCAGRRLSRVTGVDISEVALEGARARSDAEFRPLDIERDRLEGLWDLTFSSLVLEHLVDDVKALKNIRAMTSGHFMLTTIAGDFERYRPWEQQMGHVRNYRVGELEDKLRAAGFAPERVVYWGWPFYTPLARILQNRMTSEPSYGRSTRILAHAMYGLYHLNSSRRGDLLVIRARAV